MRVCQARLDDAVVTSPEAHRRGTRFIPHSHSLPTGASAPRPHLAARAATSWPIANCSGRQDNCGGSQTCTGLEMTCHFHSLLVRTGHVTLLYTKGARK